ncbi:M56 family metallopeptidase [Cohnella sp. WQ 127256]|uniref:M56 family metallopeptidase n=1 Tax=Cohnella sp. WQ 127256 TaxID=2938790 RepID=UPI002118D332|nr:M56 family metallopeptidase [Cohnella sp. WQ 127256]
MMALVVCLFLSSAVGTIIWIVQLAIRRFTNIAFSQTWHYYTGLVPVFFLLGGSEIVNRLSPLIRSISADFGKSAKSETITIAEQQLSVTPFSLPEGKASFMNSLADFVLRLEDQKPFLLLAIVIWGIGILVFLAVNIKNYWTFKHSILQESRICDNVQCSVKVIVSDHVTTPMLIGFWKPVIVLPNKPLGEKERSMILSHELVHYKRGDLYVKLLVFVANAVHWFNPAVYTMNKQVTMLCELSCDEKVVQKMDRDSRRLYGETLLSMLEYSVGQRNVICTSRLTNPKTEMKRRLINLMNEKKTKKSMMLLSLVATIALIGSGGATAYAAGSAVPSSKEITGANVTIKYSNGKVESFDKNGNKVPTQSKESIKPVKLSSEKIVDRIEKHISKGLTVPQGYIDELSQKELDILNDTHGLTLQKSK